MSVQGRGAGRKEGRAVYGLSQPAPQQPRNSASRPSKASPQSHQLWVACGAAVKAAENELCSRHLQEAEPPFPTRPPEQLQSTHDSSAYWCTCPCWVRGLEVACPGTS
eukprot:1139560-Pelagomonas_calceolata.AAC.2